MHSVAMWPIVSVVWEDGEDRQFLTSTKQTMVRNRVSTVDCSHCTRSHRCMENFSCELFSYHHWILSLRPFCRAQRSVDAFLRIKCELNLLRSNAFELVINVTDTMEYEERRRRSHARSTLSYSCAWGSRRLNSSVPRNIQKLICSLSTLLW